MFRKRLHRHGSRRAAGANPGCHSRLQGEQGEGRAEYDQSAPEDAVRDQEEGTSQGARRR